MRNILNVFICESIYLSISSFLSPSLILFINIFLNTHKNEWIIGPENINPHPSWGPALALCMLPRFQYTEHVLKGLLEEIELKC